jgi:hypothetical protein
MAIKGINGYGFTSTTTDPGTGQVATFTSPVSSFNLSSDDTEQESKGYPQGGIGLLENIYVFITERVWTLETEMQAFDWGALQLVFGRFAGTTASMKFRRGFPGSVPTSAPYSIVDATNLAGLTVDDITVSIVASTTQAFTPLEIVSAAPAAASEVHYDSAGTELTFEASAAGKSVLYYVNKAYTSVKTLGYEATTNSLDNVEFQGIVQMASVPNEIAVDIPKMGKTGGFSFQVGEANTLTFKPVVDGSNISPVRFALLN